MLDLKLIILTLVVIFNRKKALEGISRVLSKMPCDEKLLDVVKREKELYPFPPPGSNQIAD